MKVGLFTVILVLAVTVSGCTASGMISTAPPAVAPQPESTLPTSQETGIIGRVDTVMGHRFYIPAGFVQDHGAAPSSGRSYTYVNSQLDMTIEVWESTIHTLPFETGQAWISHDLADWKQQNCTYLTSGESFLVASGQHEDGTIYYCREQSVGDLIVTYMITHSFRESDTCAALTEQFASSFQPASPQNPEPAAPTPPAAQDPAAPALSAEETVKQIKQWYYAFQEEKSTCTTRTNHDATAYYLNGELCSIQQVSAGYREFYYYKDGSLYFVYREDQADSTQQTRVYLWNGSLIQWIDPSGAVRHDDPDQLLAYCCQRGVTLRSFFGQ